MPESELAKNLEEVIERVDRFAQDILKDTASVMEALKKLRGNLPGQGDRDDKEEGI